MNCTETRPLLAHRPLDALGDDELGGVDAHLSECKACASYLASLDAAYVELEGESMGSELPAGLWSGIAQRLDDGEGGTRDVEEVAEPSPALTIALVCTYCHDVLTRPEARYCAGCLAPHHADCFRAHGTCAAPGCEETHVVQPTLAIVAGGASSQRWRRGRRVWLAAALSFVGLGSGVAAAWKARSARMASEAAEARYLESRQKQDSISRDLNAQSARQRARQAAERRRRMALQRRLEQAEDESSALLKAANGKITSRRVYLGVRVVVVSSRPDQGTSERGLRVAEMRPGSVAERAGVRVGDRLLAVDGKPVPNLASIGAALRGVGETFTIHVRSENNALRILLAGAPPGVDEGLLQGAVHARPRQPFKDGRSWLAVYSDADLSGRTFETLSVEADVHNGNALRTRHLSYLTLGRRRPRAEGWDLPPEWRVDGGWIANDTDSGLWLKPVQTDAQALLRAALRLNVDVDRRHRNLLHHVNPLVATAALEAAIAAREFAGRELAIGMLCDLWEGQEQAPPQHALRAVVRAQADEDPSVSTAAKRALERLRKLPKK